MSSLLGPVDQSPRAFPETTVARLGQVPTLPKPTVQRKGGGVKIPAIKHAPHVEKTLVGVDVFLAWRGAPDELGDAITKLGDEALSLSMITNRGVKVYPDGFPETFCTDHWRCRYKKEGGGNVTHQNILGLLGRFVAAGYDVIKTENLYNFDGQAGFSAAQGQ